MLSPADFFGGLYGKIKREWKLAFLSCFLLGLLVHMPVLLSDIPNHDGLDSMYFDQNMITSGRWFLTVACGFSSYFTVPWVIGIIGLFFLGCGAAALCEFLEIRQGWAIVLCSGLLVTFPALCATFAYVFTLDGYMLALLLAVLAALFTKKYRLGFLPGAICLAFSMGTYQAYLAVTMILSVFAVLELFVAGEEKFARLAFASGGKDGDAKRKADFRARFLSALHYLYMGVIGVGLYYGLLQLLLWVQGKELAGYQGIDGMVSGAAAESGLLFTLVKMYKDFVGFTFGGNVLFQNIFTLIACVVLALAVFGTAIFAVGERKWWKNPIAFVIIGVMVLVMPVITNIILLVSPNVTYHLLMRYQWVLFLIGAVALASNVSGTETIAVGEAVSDEKAENHKRVWPFVIQWCACVAAFVLVFGYAVTDNIAYSNLQKKYEKTYAYCMRLLDRIEQTEGYYHGIPIAMIGVVGNEQFPTTDLTGGVTSNIIGMNGDYLLYTGVNYREFMEHYLGATLNILPAEAMGEMYYSEEYTAMDSFPGENSIRIIDGVMYIKTENTTR